jgi:hypothetical protein
MVRGAEVVSDTRHTRCHPDDAAARFFQFEKRDASHSHGKGMK